MMKHFLILLSALVLAQGLKEEEFIPRTPVENDAEALLGPLLKEYFEFQNLIEEIRQHQETQQISSLVLAEQIASVPEHCLPTDMPDIKPLDSDACNNLKKSLAKAVSLAQNIGSWAYQAGLKICGKIISFHHCANINPFTSLKCVLNHTKDLKETIQGYKPDVLNFKEEIVALAKELKLEFNECVKEQKKAQATAEEVVVQAQLCEETKL